MHLLADDITRIKPACQPGGRGIVEVSRAAGGSVITRLAAGSPLKLLAPKSRGDSAWIFASTYGGGLLAGDSIRLDLTAAEETRCLLSTQSSTKVYRSSGAVSRQQLNVVAAEGSIIVSAPDPIVCFAGARYAQRQRFRMAQDGGLVAIDWLTSGRRARGERWAFDRYESDTEVSFDDRCIFRERIVLDPIDGSLASPMRMGLFDCVATVLIAGTLLRREIEQLLSFVAAQPASRRSPLLFAASPIDSGVVLRVAGVETETVGRWLRDRLAFVVPLLGEDPWRRKW